MKILVPGGSGFLGRAVVAHFHGAGHNVVVLSRRPDPGDVGWDGESLGPWAKELDGADVVVNLAGRSVNCRYGSRHLAEMMDSRVKSARVVGRAIADAKIPPDVWLQASTATIYAHRFDAPNDELTGVIGGSEPGAPRKWVASIEIARAWECELEAADTSRTRKVAMRAAMVMGVEKGSAFDTLATLATRGLGGPAGDGRQFMSWIHEADFLRSLDFLIERRDLSGPVNLASPNPLPNREFVAEMRSALGVRLALPTPAWLLEFGAVFMRTETELILKSRRVIPTRLLQAGFTFEFPEWPAAAHDLAAKWRGRG